MSPARAPHDVLFIENGDSFSWNVVDALPFERTRIAIVPGADPGRVSQGLSSARSVVIGPGPTDPVRAGLVEWVRQAAARGLPLLGICLGHQAIGLAFGARLTRARPCHGEVDAIRFEGSRWLRPDGEEPVMRYHSLALEDVRSPLRVTARNGDGLVMAVEHEHLPIAGVQFHPDSYGTANGRDMIASFFRSAGLA